PHFIESDLIDVGESLLETRIRASFEQVWRVHDMTAGAQVTGERVHTRGQPMCVVEQQNLSHKEPPGGMFERMFDNVDDSPTSLRWPVIALRPRADEVRCSPRSAWVIVDSYCDLPKHGRNNCLRSILLYEVTRILNWNAWSI